MSLTRVHARIIQHPFAQVMHGARLDSFFENERELYLDVQGLQVRNSSLFEQDGGMFERVTGNHIPLRLKFSNISRLYYDDFFLSLEDVPPDHPCRTIVHFLSWRQPKEQDIYYRIGLQGPIYGQIHFFARQVSCEKLERPAQEVCIERDWSPAPPMPGRLVPRPRHLYRQFGGDPVSVRLHGKLCHRRLFIGELEVQPKRRPQVDAVLNLGEQHSRWVKGNTLHPNDRAINKGEGRDGMTVAEICNEAQWVIERLEQNQRVLVHCLAGMNRSVTICCAVLMLLEGLRAQAALERVREHHPWARPDYHHWLMLRRLEFQSGA